MFKEKINQGNLFFSDPQNPRVKFNISKYYEFKYGTQLCEADVRKPHEIEEILNDLDVKAKFAMLDPKEIKKSPFLATIDLVLKELDERQSKG